MNKNLPLICWVAALLFGFSALLNGFFVFQQVMIYKDLQNLNVRLTNTSQFQAVAQSLVNDLVAYGQRQPAIDPLLRKYGVNPPPPQHPAPPR